MRKAIQMIDDGECEHITPGELEILSNILNLPDTMGREDSAKFLGLSLNRFHELIHEGTILPPRKVVGFKELHYYRSDLKKALEIINLKGDKTH